MAKRSQLVVGQEWAYRGKRIHEHTPWNSHKKATIVAVEPYQRGYSKNYQTEKGNGVLVTFGKYDEVVQLSQLWKPWAEYEIGQAEYEAQHKINQEKQKIARAEREKFQQEVYRPALKEFFQAIKPYIKNPNQTYIDGSSRIQELPVEVLQAVTKAIQEKAVA
jgi:hypothetical protein